MVDRPTKLRKRPKAISRSDARRSAMGKALMLAIGVSNYDPAVFDPLKKCVSDAQAVGDAFREVHQLEADQENIRMIASGSKMSPSRNRIIGELKKIVQDASSGDRLFVYYSGHGTKVHDKLYLVPEDAYATDPDCLVPFDDVVSIIRGSDAKQKVFIIDACYSGPLLRESKVASAKPTLRQLDAYIQKSKGVAVIGASAMDQEATVKSPSPSLSLFTYYLVEALRGEPSALVDNRLTVSSLFSYVSKMVQIRAKEYRIKQSPVLSTEQATGDLLLGDFNLSILSPDSLEIDHAVVDRVVFGSEEGISVNTILTSISRWSYSIEHIENVANSAIPDHFRDTFGRLVPKIRKVGGFHGTQVGVQDHAISFPGGEFLVRYAADTKKTGTILYEAIFESEVWASQQGKMIELLKVLIPYPGTMELSLSRIIQPADLIPGLNSKGWLITYELSDKVEASQDGHKLIIEPHSIKFTNFSPGQLFGQDLDESKVRLAASVTQLLT